MSIDRFHLPGLSRDGSDLGAQLDRIIAHVRRRRDGQGAAVQTRFEDYKAELFSNRDGMTTALSTSFTDANHSLVAPVAHSYWNTSKGQRSIANLSRKTSYETPKGDVKRKKTIKIEKK